MSANTRRIVFKPTNFVIDFEDRYFVESGNKVLGTFTDYWDAKTFADAVLARGRDAVYVFTREAQVESLHQPRRAA